MEVEERLAVALDGLHAKLRAERLGPVGAEGQRPARGRRPPRGGEIGGDVTVTANLRADVDGRRRCAGADDAELFELSELGGGEGCAVHQRAGFVGGCDLALHPR